MDDWSSSERLSAASHSPDAAGRSTRRRPPPQPPRPRRRTGRGPVSTRRARCGSAVPASPTTRVRRASRRPPWGRTARDTSSTRRSRRIHLSTASTSTPPSARSRRRTRTFRSGLRERLVATAQASRFSQVCRVYAPMYRQVTLGDDRQAGRDHHQQLARRLPERGLGLPRLPRELQPRPGDRLHRPLPGSRDPGRAAQARGRLEADAFAGSSSRRF